MCQLCLNNEKEIYYAKEKFDEKMKKVRCWIRRLFTFQNNSPNKSFIKVIIALIHLTDLKLLST